MIIKNKLTFRAVAEVIGLLVGAFSMIYISRVIGPEYLGFSATTSAVVLLASRLADGGLTALVSQRLARDDEKLDSLLVMTIPPKILISSILICCSLILSNLLSIDVRLKYFITITVFMIFFEACTPAWVFVALGLINIASVIRIGQSVTYAIAILIFLRKPEDWKCLPYLTVFNSVANFSLATGFLCYLKLYSLDTNILKHGYFDRLKNIYREGFHFLKADLSTYVFTTSDRLILYYFTNSYTVGIYEAAYKVINPFYSIAAVISPTMFRDFAQSFKHGNIYPVMAKYLFSMSIFTIPLGFFLVFFSKFIVHLLYGARFAESANPLIILGFVITFGFTSGIIAFPFCTWNMSREFGNSVFWGNVVNTILNFMLIPFFGAIGAAFSTLAAKIVVTLVAYFYFIKTTDYPVIKDFMYFFAASAFPLLLVFLLSYINSNNYFLITVYGLIYMSLVLFMYKTYFKHKQKAITS